MWNVRDSTRNSAVYACSLSSLSVMVILSRSRDGSEFTHSGLYCITARESGASVTLKVNLKGENKRMKEEHNYPLMYTRTLVHTHRHAGRGFECTDSFVLTVQISTPNYTQCLLTPYLNHI